MSNEELVGLIQQGIDVQENMGKLYEQNYKYIRKLVYPYFKTFGNSNMFEIDDLLQESYFAIYNAVYKYDANKNVRFISFAAPFIKLTAKRFIEGKLSTVNIPINKINLAWQYKVLKNKYGSQQDDFFAQKLNISVYRFSKIKKITETSKIISMDFEYKDDESESTLHNHITANLNTEDEVIKKMTDEKMNKLWDTVKNICNEKEFQVVTQHYKYDKSFKKIGTEIGKHEETARRYNANALKKLYVDEKIIEIAEMYFDYEPRCAFHYGVGRFKNTMTSSTEFIVLKHLKKEEKLVKYWLSPNGILRIKKWVDLGMMKQQIASNMGISRQTLQRWRKQYSKIAEIFERKADIK